MFGVPYLAVVLLRQADDACADLVEAKGLSIQTECARRAPITRRSLGGDQGHRSRTIEFKYFAATPQYLSGPFGGAQLNLNNLNIEN